MMSQGPIANGDDNGLASFSGDNPLLDPGKDLMDSAPFSRLIAESISRMHPKEGIVMAVNGPWGSGKSTVLNFILYYLKHDFADQPVIPIRFNPWWFSGREDITRLLIDQIGMGLGNKDYKELKSNLAAFSELVSNIPGVPGNGVFGFFATRLRGQQDLVSLKDKIDNQLRSSNKQILVIVDDIDRLAPDEICDLFRTIKATANFPNVIYLLAFDIDIVVQSLEKGFIPSGAGRDYLEKIVQVPFPLPIPDKTALRKLFFGKLNEITTGTEEGNFDNSYWLNVYFAGLDTFISTPRDVVRLTNVLQATYPSVKGKVNSVDFIAIEAIRVFTPKLYDAMRGNQKLLTNVDYESTQWETKDERRAIFEAWLELLPEGEKVPAKNLLSLMFPKFSAALGGPLYGPEWESTWRKQLRICSADEFPIYFRFSLSPDSISNAEIKDLLRITGNQVAFGNALLEYANQTRFDGSSKVRAVLERLEDYTKEDIPEQNIQTIMSTFFDIGDKLLLERDEPRGIFGFGNDIQISRVIHQLLGRVNEEMRLQIASSAIQNGSAISVITHETAVWGQEHGKFGASGSSPAEERTFSADHLKIIEDYVLDKIIETAENSSLLSVPVPYLVHILYAWSTWAGSDNPAREWVDDIIQTDEGLVSILPHFGSVRRGQTAGDLTVRHKYRLDPEWLKPFTDPDKVAERLMKMDISGLKPEQKKAVQQFLHEYDLRMKGKNPDIEPWRD